MNLSVLSLVKETGRGRGVGGGEGYKIESILVHLNLIPEERRRQILLLPSSLSSSSSSVVVVVNN